MSGVLTVSVKPLRRVVTRGSLRVTGRFASRKMRASIPWESLIEKAFLVLAELDPTVTKIHAQATELLLQDEAGCTRKHIPDFVLVTAGGIEVHEVKSDAEAEEAQTQALFRRAANYVGLCHGTYSVARESAIKAQPTFGNASALHRYLHDPTPPALSIAALEVAQDTGGLPVRHLAERTARWGGEARAILTLAAQGTLRLDLAKQVDADAMVWAPSSSPRSPRLVPLSVPRERTP